MRWVHRADVEWCNHRKNYLCATNFKSLKSSLARASQQALAGEKVLPAFATCWEEKHSDTEADPISYDEQARGHVLEPFAIESYNKYSSDKFHHWDDVIIVDEDRGIGFSPDGLDIPNPGVKTKYDISELPEITKMIEIKSYNPGHHAKQITASKTALEERFQIAWAMFVCPTIKEAKLVFYCPQAFHQLYEVTYTREELIKELSQAQVVLDLYKSTDRLMREIPHDMKSIISEQEIWNLTQGQ